MINLTQIVLPKLERGEIAFDEPVGDRYRLIGDAEYDTECVFWHENPHERIYRVSVLGFDDLILWDEEADKEVEFEIDEGYVIKEIEK